MLSMLASESEIDKFYNLGPRDDNDELRCYSLFLKTIPLINSQMEWSEFDHELMMMNWGATAQQLVQVIQS